MTIENDNAADKYQSVFCPICGYELSPIPQGQCSECGFGYDHAAIREVANEYAWQRVGSYETATLFSAIAFGCFMVQHMSPFWTFLFARILILAGVTVVVVHRYVHYLRWTAWSWLSAVGLISGGMLVSRGLPLSVLIPLGVAATGLAAVAGFWQRPRWPYLRLSVSEKMNGKILMYQRAFVVAASIAVLAGLRALLY